MSAGGVLAAVLASEGVSFVLVGSAALQLRGADVEVHDADVVVEPTEDNLRRLGAVLEALSLDGAQVPTELMARRSVVSVPTSFGQLDCMLERGREEWPLLSERASWVRVAGVPVLVASLLDAEELRSRFKDALA